MDAGTLGFVADGQWLGTAFKGLRGKGQLTLANKLQYNNNYRCHLSNSKLCLGALRSDYEVYQRCGLSFQLLSGGFGELYHIQIVYVQCTLTM